MQALAGVSPFHIAPAYVASLVAVLIVGYVGARQQHAYAPILWHTHARARIDWPRLGIVVLILVFAVGANVAVNISLGERADDFPFIGVAVWLAIAVTAGSMLWFGLSAGVAVANMYPEARSVGSWLRHGWHVAVAYVAGFAAMLAILAWQPLG